MQIVRNSQHSIHPLFSEIEELYALVSTKQQEQTLLTPTFKSVFKPVFELVYKYTGIEYKVEYTDAQPRQTSTFKTENIPNTIILCYSGGKDSTATALHYIKEGYDVILYHLKGINKTYRDEWQNVYKMAQMLGLPVVFEEVNLIGSQEWTEHPLKNWIIAGRALQYGISHHITTNIAFGNFSTSTLENDPFEVCASDCKEMWNVYNNIVDSIIPGFKVQTPLESMKDTLDILLEHKKIAVQCQSCIGPYRYRDYLHDNNVKKYGVQLPEKHCGSCWKCCLEYIVYTDNDIYEYNEEFYKHCMEVLRNTLKKEQGIDVKTPQEIWSHYFFYNIDRSKCYG